MKKVWLLVLVIIVLLCGCDNKKEDIKNEYLSMKNKLLKIDDFSMDDVNCDISVDIDRVDDEKILYKVSISNPLENMNDIKALLIHNYYTEDVFPSVGLFNDTFNLEKNSSDDLVLSGYIETDNDIDNLNLILKLYIKYTDDNGNKKDIYYKSTK